MTGVLLRLQIHECREAGLKKAATGRKLGLHRNTVAKYWDRQVSPESPHRGHRSKKIDPYVDYIKSRLEAYPELSAERIFQEISEKGYAGSNRTVRRYVFHAKSTNHREYKPYETLPGEQAQVDWGDFGQIIVDGGRVKVYGFVFCLAWSRAMYVEFVDSMDMATFSNCMHNAFVYIGGVTHTTLFDNAKVVVSEREGSVVRFNSHLLKLASVYGFSPKACWVSDPESKGKVESGVKYVKYGFFYGREFKDIADVNQQARKWLDEVANRRIHGTTNEIPFERLEHERKYLKDASGVAGPVAVSETRKASKTGLISVMGNRYSVPDRLARRQVKCFRYVDRIEIVDADGSIAVIPLVAGKGQTIINDDHYPKHAAKTGERKSKLQIEFEELAPEAAEYLQGLSRKGNGHLKEQMQRIVALGRGYSKEELSAAMSRSLEYGCYGFSKLKRILERQIATETERPKARKAQQTTYDVPVDKRDTSYYGGVAL